MSTSTSTPAGPVTRPDPVSPVAGLRLARLTLSGFKSFADKTVFEFDSPLTGVVGPNGCGKSNIVDAIKWVLGERSSKSLRGKEMIDVIFAGSAARKPSGMACVMLTFDNPVLAVQPQVVGTIAEEAQPASQPQPEAQASEPVAQPAEIAETAEGAEAVADDAAEPTAEGRTHDEHVSDAEAEQAAEEGASEAASIISDRARARRPLPIDSEVVEVERRLYRDGKSQYLINGKLARLRDIRDLFLDTGVGADAYSIIEQGKVDAMLLASPMERRSIFEEAAGIAKFRQRRVEAERKLERTEANLVRTREQLSSTERRLRLVRGQAAKARRYQELADEHDALRLAVAFEQYDDVCQRLSGLTSQLAALETRQREARAEVEAAEAARQDVQLARESISRELRHAEQNRTNAAHTAERATERKSMAQRAIEEGERRAEADEGRVKAAAERLTQLATDIDDHRDRVAALSETLAEAEAELTRAGEARAEAMAQSDDARRTAREARSRASGIERDRNQLAARESADAERIRGLGEQLEKVAGRVAALGAEIAGCESAQAKAGGELREADERVASAKAELDGFARTGEALDGTRRELADKVASLDERFLRLDARRQTLAEMVAKREGLGEAARAVLEAKEKGEGFAGVIGSLAEMIDADQTDAAVVEAALGASLSALLVESVGAMPSDAELATLPGRAVFVPAQAAGRVEAAAFALLGISERAVALRGLVRARDPRARAVLSRLLGRTALVESLDAAMLLAAGPLAGWRFVTREGVVLEADGRVVAGPTGEAGAGVLERRAELEAIEREADEVSWALEAQRARLESVDTEAAQLEARRTTVAAALAEHERDTMRAQARVERLGTDRDRLGRELASARQDHEQHQVRLAGLKREREELRERAERLGRLFEEQRTAAEDAERVLAEHQGSLEKLGERLAAARVEAGRVGEQVQSAKRELGRLERERDEAERAHADAERHAAGARERIAEHRETAANAEKQALEAGAQQETFAAEVAQHRARLGETDEAASEANARVTRAREGASHVERDWHAVESGRRELEVRRETLEERAEEDMAVNLAGEYLDYRAVMAPGDVVRIDLPDAQARVNVLRGEINKLGNVNLDSISEETQLEERNDDLIAQVRDIDEARIRLATLIEKLAIASRDRFGEVFEKIRGEFGGQNGMFRKLFGGGRAEVRLMPLVKEVDGQKVVTDEVDLLESGVEVIAKPPGKEPRSISQLSGGEKTMTAVALLLAIFRSKPSCFCVLDEVDAALDEANVGRYARTVREFTDLSRFIVITHNKRTMQAVDQLYGVTMQERGVSKRVSVKFDQVSADGSIDKKAVEASRQADSKPEPVADAAPEESKPKLRSALAKMREEANAGA